MSIQGDSLLSNISNISGKIELKACDGSAFFRNCSDENEREVEIDAIPDDESFHQESLLQKINDKTKENMRNQVKRDGWLVHNFSGGLSEDQGGSENQINTPLKQQASVMIESLSEPSQKPPEANQDSAEQRRQQKLLQKRLKNETKNIPKNYGKAIITFIEKYQDKVREVTRKNKVDYIEFIEDLKEKKKTINTIADLRYLWIDYKYARCMRLLSHLFLRKYSLNYIFNSRICNYNSHIKYRYRLCEAIKEPKNFKHIKDY